MARFGYNSGIDQYGLSGNTRGRGSSDRHKAFGAPGSRAGTSLKPPGKKDAPVVLPPPGGGGGGGNNAFNWKDWGIGSLGMMGPNFDYKKFEEQRKRGEHGKFDWWKEDPGAQNWTDKTFGKHDEGGWLFDNIRWAEGTERPTFEQMGYTGDPDAWIIRDNSMRLKGSIGWSDLPGMWWRGANSGSNTGGGIGGTTGGTMGGTMGGTGDGMASMGSGLSGPPGSKGMFPGSRESDKGPFTDPSTVPGTKSNMQAQQRANPPGGPRTKGLSSLGDLSPTPSSSLSGPPAGNMAGNQQQKTDAQAPIDRLREIMGGTNQVGTEAGSAPQPSILDLVNKRQAEKNTLAPPPQEQEAPQQQVPQQQVSGFYAGDPSKGIPGEWDHMKGKWPSQTLSGALRDRKEQARNYTPPGKDPAPPGKVWRISGWTGEWVLVDEGVMT